MRESESTRLTLATPEAMHEFGMRLGDALLQGADTPQCVFLEGELGAGKTTLVGGILSAFGIPGPARSPTYTLIEPYEANGRQLYHIDLYRLAEPEEIEPLGLRDLLVPGAVLLIEWPSRAPGRLPACDLRVCIEYAEPLDAGRHLTLASGTSGTAGRLRRLLL
jgi:tRNA threonylcarbamoyladenosine biosynthesis protein TsaE